VPTYRKHCPTSRKLKSVQSVQQLEELFKEMETENNVGGGQAILQLLLNNTWFSRAADASTAIFERFKLEFKSRRKVNVEKKNYSNSQTNRKFCECILKWRTHPPPYLASLNQVG
jgi:hypothetical protein